MPAGAQVSLLSLDTVRQGIISKSANFSLTSVSVIDEGRARGLLR